jgi:hypothetical protein
MNFFQVPDETQSTLLNFLDWNFRAAAETRLRGIRTLLSEPTVAPSSKLSICACMLIFQGLILDENVLFW